MDHDAIGEQLAAYTADELPADERAALEARLAREPALRARLDAIRRSDAALASLPAVEPPAEFSARLRATLADELARTPTPVDELAVRREQRRQRFLRGAGLAAAAAGVAAVATFGLGSLFDGGGSDDDMAAMEALESAPQALDIVRVSDTDYDADSLPTLADDAAVDPRSLGALSDAEAQDLARRNTEALGFTDTSAATLQAPAAEAATTGGATSSTQDEMVTEDTAEAANASEAGADGAAIAEPAAGDPTADAQRCATEIIASTGTLIPLLAEVASFEGEPAVLYLFASPDPDDGSFTRLEIWAAARSDCSILHFTQLEL